MKKLLFIYNPYTGGGKLKNRLFPIINTFNEAGYEVHAIPTAAKGHATRLVLRYAKKADLLVCCGGDGTLNEVVSGLSRIDNPPVLGYIPGGTTNDFASSLRLPKNNMMSAAQRIICPKNICSYDIGEFNDRVFNYVAAFGAFTGVSYETPQSMKNMLGYLAYIIEGAQHIQNPPTYRVHIKGEDRDYEGDFLLGFISNSRSIGGINLPKDFKANLDDGVFEVLLVHSPSSLPDFALLSSALIRKNIHSPALTVFKAREIRLLSKEPIAWTLDGEYGGEHTDVCIKVRQKAIKICV